MTMKRRNKEFKSQGKALIPRLQETFILITGQYKNFKLPDRLSLLESKLVDPLFCGRILNMWKGALHAENI